MHNLRFFCCISPLPVLPVSVTQRFSGGSSGESFLLNKLVCPWEFTHEQWPWWETLLWKTSFLFFRLSVCWDAFLDAGAEILKKKKKVKRDILTDLWSIITGKKEDNSSKPEKPPLSEFSQISGSFRIIFLTSESKSIYAIWQSCNATSWEICEATADFTLSYQTQERIKGKECSEQPGTQKGFSHPQYKQDLVLLAPGPLLTPWLKTKPKKTTTKQTENPPTNPNLLLYF